MPDTIAADVPHIRTVSSGFDTLAQDVADTDTAVIDAGVADGFPGGAAVVDALAEARGAVARACALLADRSWALHDTMNVVLTNYENTDEHFANELSRVVAE